MAQQVITKALLSGSTNGKGKLVTGTTTGTSVTIHTHAGASTFDEVYLYAYNGHTTTVLLTIEWGEATVPDGNILINFPGKAGRFLIVDGRLINGSLAIKAFAATANVIVIDGFVNQIT